MLSIDRAVAVLRGYYHAMAVDLNGALGQLGLISQEKWESSNWQHFCTVAMEVYPRLHNGHTWFEDNGIENPKKEKGS